MQWRKINVIFPESSLKLQRYKMLLILDKNRHMYTKFYNETRIKKCYYKLQQLILHFTLIYVEGLDFCFKNATSN